MIINRHRNNNDYCAVNIERARNHITYDTYYEKIKNAISIRLEEIMVSDNMSESSIDYGNVLGYKHDAIGLSACGGDCTVTEYTDGNINISTDIGADIILACIENVADAELVEKFNDTFGIIEPSAVYDLSYDVIKTGFIDDPTRIQNIIINGISFDDDDEIANDIAVMGSFLADIWYTYFEVMTGDEDIDELCKFIYENVIHIDPALANKFAVEICTDMMCSFYDIRDNLHIDITNYYKKYNTCTKTPIISREFERGLPKNCARENTINEWRALEYVMQNLYIYIIRVTEGSELCL